MINMSILFTIHPPSTPLYRLPTLRSSIHQQMGLTLRGNNGKLSNNLVSEILSMKGLPEVRIGSASDTNNHHQWLSTIMTLKAPQAAQYLLYHQKNKKKRGNQTQNSLEETPQSILVLVSLAVKYPKWLQSELKSPSGAHSFYLWLRKKNDLKI